MNKNWTNGMEGRTAFLDKYALEDVIVFQHIEVAVLDGYYYDEGFNTKIKAQCQEAFDKRKVEKDAMGKHVRNS